MHTSCLDSHCTFNLPPAMLSPHAFTSHTTGSHSPLPRPQSRSLFHEAGLLFATHILYALFPGFSLRAQHFFAKISTMMCKDARSTFAKQGLKLPSRNRSEGHCCCSRTLHRGHVKGRTDCASCCWSRAVPGLALHLRTFEVGTGDGVALVMGLAVPLSRACGGQGDMEPVLAGSLH